MWSQTRVQPGSEYGYATTHSGVSQNWVPAQILNLSQDQSCPQLQPERLLPAVDIRQWRVMLVKVLRRGWMLNPIGDILINFPCPTLSPTLLHLKKYHARGGWRNVRVRQWRSEFSEMLPSGHIKAIAVMNSHQLCIPAHHPYKAKPTKLSPRWGRRCLSHTPYWGAINRS